MRAVLALAILFVSVTVAHADQKGDCGTIVLPTGIGESSSDDVTSMNALLANSAYNEEAAELAYQSLVWINRFDEIDWSRSLASAITTPDNGTTYDVTLRPWHWSDGVPVTTADVAYAFSLIKQLGETYTAYGQGGMPEIVKSLNIISPSQFQVVLQHQVNPTWFIYNGLPQLQPLPAHSWGKYTLDQIYQLQSTPAFFNVVDGPLKYQRLDVGLDLVTVPNPAFEGPKMHFQRLVFKFLQGDGAAVQGVESGDTDAAELPVTLFGAVQHLPHIHLQVLQASGFANVVLLNFKNPAVASFNDVRVRQAMEDSIDQKSMIDLVYHGLATAEYGPIPPVPPTFLPPDMKAGHYPVGYDPAKSRALLKAAGYTPGQDGIMQKDGKKLSFVFLMISGDGDIAEETEVLQDDFRKVGIEMIVREMEFNQMLALMSGPPLGWEAGGLGNPVLSYPTGENDFQTGSGQNFGGYSDPKMDALIAASISKPGVQALYDYAEYASAQQPFIYFPTALPALLVSDRLHGMADFVDPAGQFSPEQLYCTPAEAKK